MSKKGNRDDKNGITNNENEIKNIPIDNIFSEENFFDKNVIKGY